MCPSIPPEGSEGSKDSGHMFAEVSTNRIKGNHSKFLSLIRLQGQFLLAEHIYHPSSVKSLEKVDLGPKGETWPL